MSRILRVAEVARELGCSEGFLREAASDFGDYWLDTQASGDEVVTFSASVPQVDLKPLKVSERIKKLITEGWTTKSNYKSRSEADQAAISALLQGGYDANTIKAIFSNPEWKIGDKYREKGKAGDKYLAYSVTKAKAYAFHS